MQNDNKNIKNNEYEDNDKNMITNYNYNNKNLNLIKKIYYILNIEENLIKILCLDKIIIYLLIKTKKWLCYKAPELNKYIFRDKLSSLTINYTHYTTTYYNQHNNNSDCIMYRSIFLYVYEKKIFGCKFLSNSNGNYMFFEPFDEVQINKHIWIVSRVTTTSTSNLYTIELISYNSSVDKINKFIKYCLNKFENKIQKDSLIKSAIKYYKYVGSSNPSGQLLYDELNFIQTKTFNNIFFIEKENLVKKIKYFSDNEKSYKDLGIPWSMGILLHGKPGTGKTSCIKAIASMTQRHIIDIALSKIKTEKELTEIFYNSKINGVEIPFSKRLYVLDELDLILNKIKDRKIVNNINIDYDNKNKESDQINNKEYEGVTLENLLTILDGTVEYNGCMFVATTNYLELIDKALIRPGRFDICLHLDNANDEIIIQIIKHFASKHKNFIYYDSNSKTNTKNSESKLTSYHKKQISKYSSYQGKNIWSPAKISQICLIHIDSENYFDKIVYSLEKEYDEQCKLL